MNIGIIVGAVALLLVVAWAVRPNPLSRHTSSALATGNLDPLMGYIAERGPEDQATAFNHAVKQMWDVYQRALAASFVVAMSRRLSDVAIVHYWVKQVMEIEPEIAAENFDDEFLASVYRPDLASRCGPCG